jgi:ribosomal protein S18 acetylase RimI-like enzyme
MKAPLIREFNPDTDKQAVIGLMAELQDNEKTFDDRIPSGLEMAEKYYDWTMQRCTENSGKIFIAELGGEVAGFICVLDRMKYTDPDEYPHEYSLVDEFIVHQPFRGKGLGKALMARAEAYTKECGVTRLQLEVTASNVKARRFYTSWGFETMWLDLEKKLD